MALVRVTPEPFQKEGVRQIEAFGGRALLADDMGLGKTLQTLHWLRRNPATLPAVVVCPAPVKYHWESEAAIQVGIRGTVCEGDIPPRSHGLQCDPLYIINYDILPGWVDYFIAKGIKTLVLDECQNITSIEAERTLSVLRLARECEYALGTSGTPLTNRPKELWPILHILAPALYPNPIEFYFEFCRPKKERWGWTYDGSRNLDKLHAELIERVMIRRLKKDVLNLPPKQRRVVALDITNRAEYTAATIDFLGWLRETHGAEKAKRAAKAEQLTQIAYLRMLAARGKMRAIAGWLDNFLENSDEKLAYFCVHTKMLEAFERRYGEQCVVINGKVTGKARQERINRFTGSRTCRLLLGNIIAAGTGIDGVQRVCRTVAHGELAWNAARHIQAEDRANRLGQTRPVWSYYLVADNTIEVDICDIIQTKQANVDATLDGVWAEEDMDILDMLMERLASQGGLYANAT